MAPLLGAWLAGTRAARARLLPCRAPAPTALLQCLLGPRRAPCASASGARGCEAFRLVPCRISPPPRTAAHGRNLVGAEETDAERTVAIHRRLGSDLRQDPGNRTGSWQQDMGIIPHSKSKSQPNLAGDRPNSAGDDTLQGRAAG